MVFIFFNDFFKRYSFGCARSQLRHRGSFQFWHTNSQQSHVESNSLRVKPRRPALGVQNLPSMVTLNTNMNVDADMMLMFSVPVSHVCKRWGFNTQNSRFFIFQKIIIKAKNKSHQRNDSQSVRPCHLPRVHHQQRLKSLRPLLFLYQLRCKRVHFSIIFKGCVCACGHILTYKHGQTQINLLLTMALSG